MQFSTTTSALLLLVGSVLAAPAPQVGAAVQPPADKSNFVIADGQVGVALWQANGAGDGVIMDARDLAAGKRDQVTIHTGVTYATLEVVVGNGFNPAGIRCQVKDNHGREVFGKCSIRVDCSTGLPDTNANQGTRGQNLDTTFADGNNGRWTLDPPSHITEIICDPRFVANNRNNQGAAA